MKTPEQGPNRAIRPSRERHLVMRPMSAVARSAEQESGLADLLTCLSSQSPRPLPDRVDIGSLSAVEREDRGTLPYPEWEHIRWADLGVKLPPWVRAQVFARDGESCAICRRGDDPTVDHIVPLAAGGTDRFSNLRVLCRSCNGRKGCRPAAWYDP